MDDIVEQFLKPGAWGGRAVVEHEPPDLGADAGARLVALLVETSGGQIAVKREDLRSVSTNLLLLMRETEDSLVLDTRRVSPAPGMEDTLSELADLLRQYDEPIWADACERFATDAAAAATATERSDLARSLLRMYQSGISGFQDVVLMDHGDIAEDHGRFDSLRSELVEQAREQL